MTNWQILVQLCGTAVVAALAVWISGRWLNRKLPIVREVPVAQPVPPPVVQPAPPSHEWVRASIGQIFENAEARRFLDMSLERHWRTKAAWYPSPLLARGEKFYSQGDEDGILNAIFERLRIEQGVFVEFGCGDGLENNTLQLLMRGWKGVWVGAIEMHVRVPAGNPKLWFERVWVTRENCVEIMQRGLAGLGAGTANLISMDLDGNDIEFVKTILEQGFQPDVFVVEYNSKFPPPIRFTVDYDPNFTWRGSDYFGASLQSFVDLFEHHGFRLVCCNMTGANAFFVAKRHEAAFEDVPQDAGALFMPPDYASFLQKGHRADPRTIESFLR